MEKLRKEIKENALGPCYIFYGEESYLKNRYEKMILDLFEDQVSGDMNVTIFNSDIDVNKVIDAVETLPFLAEKRLVLIKDSKLFKSGKKNDSEKLADYLSELPLTTCLVFIEDEVDKRNKLFKSLQKVGREVVFSTPKEPQLIQWVKRELKQYEVEIDNATAAFFFRYVGESMENAYSELVKLGSYKNPGEKVGTKDIENLCIQSLEIKVFELVGAVGVRDTKKALVIYRNMLMAKESPIMILSMLTRQLRLMFQCKHMESTGHGVTSIAQRIGQRDFVVRQSLSQSKNFTLETLKKALEECLETDIAIKTGQMKDDLGVELIIVKYSN